MNANGGDPRTDAAELYLDLLKRALTRTIDARQYAHGYVPGLAGATAGRLNRALFRLGLPLRLQPTTEMKSQDLGKGYWPQNGETMISLRRLDNIQDCVTDVLRRGVPGDLIEAGVWRGGATIFMRGLLKVYGVTDRTVWVADSFRGLPPANAARYPADAGGDWSAFTYLAVPLAEVQANFARYGLLDAQVRFLAGWFSDTLPPAPIEHLAVLRLDGDMYGSTIEALTALYPKLSPGGYAIIDDYGAVPACRQAVDDFRATQRITEPVADIDGQGAFWQKPVQNERRPGRSRRRQRQDG